MEERVCKIHKRKIFHTATLYHKDVYHKTSSLVQIIFYFKTVGWSCNYLILLMVQMQQKNIQGKGAKDTKMS